MLPESPSQRPGAPTRCAGTQSTSGPPGVTRGRGACRLCGPTSCSRPGATALLLRPQAGPPRYRRGLSPEGARSLPETVAWKLGRAGGATGAEEDGARQGRAAARRCAERCGWVRQSHDRARVGGGPGPLGLRCSVPPTRGRPRKPPSPRTMRPFSPGRCHSGAPTTHGNTPPCTTCPSCVCAPGVWGILTAVALETRGEPARVEPTSPPRPTEAYAGGMGRQNTRCAPSRRHLHKLGSCGQCVAPQTRHLGPQTAAASTGRGTGVGPSTGVTPSELQSCSQPQDWANQGLESSCQLSPHPCVATPGTTGVS